MTSHYIRTSKTQCSLCWTEDNAEPAFYYHGDHLGSASYVTASNGAVVQTLNYLPYGEDWVDLQNFNVMPYDGYKLGVYKFNGKEKDFETGYHYYGARYYDSEKINWLSVDPLSDKYPSMSPYAYCANNPAILVDPDGESPVKAILSAVKISHKLYKIYKKTGKITSKSLKNAGLEEFIDIGGDIQIIFSGDATVLDRINAVADLIIGTDLNNKGQKAVKNILEKDNNSKLRKTNPSKAESKIWNDLKPFKKKY